MLISTCLYCENTYTFKYKSSQGKFCSRTCGGKYKSEVISVSRIEAGEVSEPVTLKKYLTRVRGYHCEICNLSEWQGEDISLQIDHVDGNSDHNFPNNIRLLCPNCHSQTDTYSGRNDAKGSKRATYMKNYRKNGSL